LPRKFNFTNADSLSEIGKHSFPQTLQLNCFYQSFAQITRNPTRNFHKCLLEGSNPAV